MLLHQLQMWYITSQNLVSLIEKKIQYFQNGVLKMKKDIKKFKKKLLNNLK